MDYKRTPFSAARKGLAVVVMVLAFAACGQDGSNQGQTAIELEAAAYTGPDYSKVVTPAEVRDGIVFGEIAVGNPDAPITIVEYASLTCPHCANFHRDVYPKLKDNFIKTGRVKLVYRNYTRDRADLEVGKITRCAGPDKVMDLMAVYFERQRQWLTQDPRPEIINIARQAGINRAQYDACVANTELEVNIIGLFDQGLKEDNVTATPTFFVNGQRLVGEASYETFRDLILDNF
ncbi:MAG TPA: thioredoxin domain-containing protein [Sphingomonadales bacterium]|nr:thioredoxin domain-containing protein [Sphingomonadales bacterium]